MIEKKGEEQFVFLTGASQELGNPFAEGLIKRKLKSRRQFTYPIFLLISLFMSLSIFAQQPTQSIRGTVIDKASNVPLAFVNIVIENTTKGTVTDSLGNFTFQNIIVGRYNIQVSMVGYEPLILKEIQVTSGKEVFLNIALKETAASLAEVIIKPKVNKEQPINSTATASAKMLSVEEGKRFAGGFDDPARLVSAFAGVSSSISNNAIVVRGNSPQALQWKLEGVEIPNPNHFSDLSAFGGGGLTALSSQLLDNSDFFSGAMPAEYSNALSGVFDIFMRKGNNKKAEHTLQVGLLGIDIASEGPFKKQGKSSYLFNYRYSTLALLEGLLPDNADGTKYQDLSFKLNFPTKKAGTFSVWGIGLIDKSGAEAKKNTSEWKYDTDLENQDVKQYMGAVGVTHKLFLNNKQYIKSSIATNINGIDLNTERLSNNLTVLPKNKVNNKNYNIVLSSFINSKISAKHTNKSGFVVTNMNYDLLLKNAEPTGTPLQTIVFEIGSSNLLSAYSNSTFTINEKFTINGGINTQLFTLNKHYTIEPRAGLKYQIAPAQSISFAYGLHSRLERLSYYFVKNNGGEGVNKNVDFTKSHHIVLGYDVSLSEFVHLKVEAYYQHLFNIPVIADSSFSMINQQNDWFFNGKLQNSGKGKNYGVDITFEKYLSKGYYYMITGSIFNSQYMGGDNIWRDTRYNRNYVFNFLIGKEWQTGKNKQNVLGLNARLSYQGGEHYSPINTMFSSQNQDVVFDETMAFSKQVSPAFTSHFTASYKINKKRSAQEIAFKIINATQYKEFMGFQYNHQTQKVDEHREAIFIPNMNWKIEF
ncbi:MAG: carboxypeptidase-like regulatory domain-containing protein [Bacteroidetes bacterium]|nr:MAG: carboxypeptidase-like regulatory domain-containing protein [Bacteroidota bacterium]REK34627.1 MAG: carboxypeptidase-like regulatory domain-containing protein [Bacteroidota bacterium]